MRTPTIARRVRPVSPAVAKMAKPVVGVEIASTHVRVAIPARGRADGSIQLIEVGLPDGTVREGVIVDIDTATATLKEALAKTGLGGRRLRMARAWLAVSGQRALVREIEMPDVADAELNEAARFQTLDLLPFPVEETLMAASRIPGAVDEAGFARVLVAAAHRELVEPALDVARRAGLFVEGVELSSLALLRAFPAVDERAEAIVSVGHDLTTIVVRRDGEPRFVRTVAVGGADVTEAISRAIDVPLGEARRLKHQLKVALDTPGKLRPEILVAVRDGATRLLGEIRDSLEYAGMIGMADQPGRVVFTGGGSLLAGLVDRFRLQTDARVESGDVSLSLRTEPGSSDPDAVRRAAGVAFGTVVSAPADHPRLNLLPREVLVARKLTRIEHNVRVGSLSVAALLVGFGAIRYLEANSAENAVSGVRASIASLQEGVSGYRAVALRQNSVLVDEQLALPLVEHEVNWPAILDRLSTDTPPSVNASDFDGSALTPTSVTAAATTSASSPSAGSEIATVSLSLSGQSYPAFQAWFSAMNRSEAFRVLQYSGLSSASSSVQFTAELAVTSSIHGVRASRFEEGK